MAEPEPEDLSLWMGSPRSACRLQVLFPVWLWLSALYSVHLVLRAPWSALVEGILLVSGALLSGGWVVLHTAQDVALAESRSLADSLSRMRQSLGPLFLAPMITFLTALLFFLLALAGGVLQWVPFVGGWLVLAWMLTAGLAFSLIAASWTLVGLGALPLQIAGSVVEGSSALDIVSRTFSYVRRRPLFLSGAWGAVLASSLLGTALFFLFLSFVMFGLEGILAVKAGRFPEPVTLGKVVAAHWVDPRCWCLPEGKPLSQAASWAAPAARFLPSFFLASVFSGMTRIYLSVRRREDGIPVRKTAGSPA